MSNPACVELSPEALDAFEIEIPGFPRIREEAFHGILKDFVDIAASNSEASKIAVAANVLAFFSAMVGRRAFQNIGDAVIHCRPFFLLIGKSSKARKGTSEHLPRRVFNRVDELFKQKNPDHFPLNIHGGGLSSGEGIAYAIRDSSDDGDPGISDKRLLVIEPEFANVLANCKRDNSTLSPILRNVFDGHDLAPLTKTNRTKTTKPQVVIVAHITENELCQKISSVEISNGLLNRFLFCCIAREQFKPLPERTSRELIEMLALELVDIFNFIDTEIKNNPEGIEICLSKAAQEYWKRVYTSVSTEAPGIAGSLLARSELYALMLAMIMALLDKKITIEIEHLKSALCWIDYVGSSVRFLFQEEEESELEKLTEEILKKLMQQGQMTRAELNDAFHGHKKSSELTRLLEYLLSQTPPRIIQFKEPTGGRPKVIYKVCDIS